MSASRTSPATWLILLLAVATAASGWIYGLRWKQAATKINPTAVPPSNELTHEERLIIDLQDQLDALRTENQRLVTLIHEMESESKPKPAPSPSALR